MKSFFKRPKILGIVNITHDSFSDGGKFIKFENALAHSLNLIRDGADILDLGAQSSNLNSKIISAQEEIKRLEHLIEELNKNKISLSIDSFKTEVQRFALSKKVNFINDTSGFKDQSFYEELKSSNCKLIVMHSIQKDGLANINFFDEKKVFENIIKFFEYKINLLTKNNIKKENLILDPGMGFFLGSNFKSSTYVLKNIDLIKNKFSGFPLLFSVSSKSFLGKILNDAKVDERKSATLATELYLCLHRVEYIRTHDVKALNDALKIWEELI